MSMAMIQAGMLSAREMEANSPPPSPPTPKYDEPESEEVTLYKHSVNLSLGLRFMDPMSYTGGTLRADEGTTLCIVESIIPGSISDSILRPGDRVVAIEGDYCSGPADAAHMLRALEGYIRIEIVHDALALPSPPEGWVPRRIHASDDSASLSDDDDSKTSSPSETPRPTGSNSPPQSGNQPPKRGTTGAFHLNLAMDAAPSLAITGSKGHVRLGKNGSSGQLLRASGVSPRRSLMNGLGSMLSPRA